MYFDYIHPLVLLLKLPGGNPHSPHRIFLFTSCLPSFIYLFVCLSVYLFMFVSIAGSGAQGPECTRQALCHGAASSTLLKDLLKLPQTSLELAL